MTNCTKNNSHKTSTGGYKNERASKDGRKYTKGGKGGKVQVDGTDHRSMGYLVEEFTAPTMICKSDFQALATSEADNDSEASE